MTTRVLGRDDEPQDSGAIVAVNYGDYRSQECKPRAAGRRGARSDQSERRFNDFIETRGGTILEPEWLGSMYKHRVRCAEGHEIETVPNALTQKTRRHYCRICAGQDSATADAAFRRAVESLGGVVIEPAWLGSVHPHRVRCVAGHYSSPTPGNVARGQGICPACAGHFSDETRRAFEDRVAELGGRILEDRWLGVDHPHRIQCSVGHLSTPRPTTVAKGHGICRACAGQCPVNAEAAFRRRIATLGGVVLEPAWLGANRPHRIRCAAGHLVETRPDRVGHGIGPCHECAGWTWNIFYLVTDVPKRRLKFGVTSGDPRTRLRKHAQSGYRRRVLCTTFLRSGEALQLERTVRSALKDAGELPVQGREYFDISVEALVQDIADGWRNGRKHMWDGLEEAVYDDPEPPR